MMKRLMAAILACTMIALPVSAFAKQSYDFSDIATPFIKWPFNVVNVEITGEFFTMHHIYHVTESYETVIKKLTEIYEKNEKIGNYKIMGLTPQTQSESHRLVIGYQNEHHYINISPEGSGSVLAFEAMPSSYMTGIYDATGYGFLLSDGTTANLYQAKEE
ncbi:MAG: hypothetical protein IKY83_07485 [Proteobacteria bacterium]|nr:hypothetical protein [Pseudomonadota bacterium]